MNSWVKNYLFYDTIGSNTEEVLEGKCLSDIVL